MQTEVELAPGYSISRILKGGWQLAGGHGPVERSRAISDMFAFAEAGITTFDCADIYTGVEELIGEFLRAWRAAHPALSGSIHVHTKYVPDLDALASLTRAQVEATIDRSLQRLGVERLDLVQFHWWDYAVPGYVEAAGHLTALKDKGKIRNLGVTNFDSLRLSELLAAGVPVVANQVQYSLLDRRPAGAMSALCKAHGVQLLCYGALAGGFVSQRWLDAPEPAGEQENRSLTKYKLIIDEFGGWAAFQRLLGTLAGIGRRHGVAPGTVALRWTLDQEHVAAAIAGARNAAHLEGTLAALRLRLSDADRGALAAAVAGAPGPLGDTYGLERVQGGPHASIMKYNLNREPPTSAG